KVSL
ncbi:hypothetical protein N499_0998B, partial [Wolbachia pipientis wVitA]